MKNIGLLAALLPVTSAYAQGQLFIANLNGSNVVPPNTSLFTGTVYAVLDKPETGVTYYFTHNIDTGLTGGEVRRGAAGQPGTSTKFVFPNPASPGGPYPSVVVSPALDSPLMRMVQLPPIGGNVLSVCGEQKAAGTSTVQFPTSGASRVVSPLSSMVTVAYHAWIG